MVDMMRHKKYWMLLCVLGIMCLAGAGIAATLQGGPSLSAPVFVLLYHPDEVNFESTFRDHLAWLKQNGYQTISPETLIDYLDGKVASLPSKPILLTFDDGTIENFSIVYPVLQEFGYTGVSFVITSSDFTSYSQKAWWRTVDRSGILEIESHSHSHGLVWTGPEIVDFFSGEEDDYYLIKGRDSRLGAPIYQFDYELISNRYLPDKRIADLCVRYVAQNGGTDFFKKANWENELLLVVENFRNHYQERGSYEQESQRMLRLRTELYRSKKFIELTIGRGKEVEYFAYPWGVYDEELILQLKSYGYRGAFTTDGGGNLPGDDPFKIKRSIITSTMTVEDLAAILGGG